MVTVVFDVIVDFLYRALGALMGLLPLEPAPPDVVGHAQAWVTTAQRYGVLSALFPIEVVYGAMYLILGLWFVFMVWEFVHWILVLLHVAGN